MKALKDMINNIKDPKLKHDLLEVANGVVVGQVSCLSKKCKGRVVGKIYKNGRIDGIREKDGKMYLKASRQRLDGNLGFECWCGNDSRLADQEKGIVGSSRPTKEDLTEVFNRVNKKPTKIKENGNVTTIDGFAVEMFE